MGSVAVGVAVSDAAAVNKKELALRLKVSLPTLSRWIDRNPDFPVLSRGTNGASWSFDLAAVFAFLRQLRDAEKAKAAARDEELAQLALPFDLPTDPAVGLTIKDQLQALELRRRQREMAEKEGLLVSRAAMQQALHDAMVKQSAVLHAALARECAELNLPDDVARRLDAAIAEAQRAWVAEMRLRAPIDPEAKALAA